MEAVKCDRCGIYFDKNPSISLNSWHELVSGFTVAVIIDRNGNPSGLCPPCIDALAQEAVKQREKLRSLLK